MLVAFKVCMYTRLSTLFKRKQVAEVCGEISSGKTCRHDLRKEAPLKFQGKAMKFNWF